MAAMSSAVMTLATAGASSRVWGQPVAMADCQRHRDQTAAGRPQNDHPVEGQMIQQFDCVQRLALDVVVRVVRVMIGTTAPAIIHCDHAVIGHVGRKERKIPTIARQSCQTQDRSACAIVLIIDAPVVRGREKRHQRPASFGIEVRSDRI